MIFGKSSLNATTATEALHDVGFDVIEVEPDSSDVYGQMGHERTECLECSRADARVRVCLHHFSEGLQAIDAATEVGMRTWPEGLARTGFAHGRVVAVLYGRRDQETVLQQAAEALH